MYRSASHENYSRSILKPEYTHWGHDSYPVPGASPPKRSLPRRQSVHPYSRYMPDFSMPNVRGNYTSTTATHKPLDYQAAAIKQRYMNMQKHKFNTTESPAKKNSPPTRSPHHGQAEQLRRSRESNTFSLIDAQLSKAPLERIRDMYLQVKGISTNAGNVPRTTKKANLSAVHAIVRFRIRDYLLDLREHSRRLLDQVIASQRPEDCAQRHKDIDQIYANLSPFPCSRDCIHCEKLHTRPERPRATPVRRLPIPTTTTNNNRLHPNRTTAMSRQPTAIRIKTEEPFLPAAIKISSPPPPPLTNDSSEPDDFLLSSEELLPTQAKRNRIDSNVTRFCQELGLSAIDWSTDAAGISGGDFSVDLNQLFFGDQESPGRFSAAEDDNLCSPTTCDDSDTQPESLLLSAADIPVN